MGTVSYEWFYRTTEAGSGTSLGTGGEYVIQVSDTGRYIYVSASYTDLHGSSHSDLLSESHLVSDSFQLGILLEGDPGASFYDVIPAYSSSSSHYQLISSQRVIFPPFIPSTHSAVHIVNDGEYGVDVFVDTDAYGNESWFNITIDNGAMADDQSYDLSDDAIYTYDGPLTTIAFTIATADTVGTVVASHPALTSANDQHDNKNFTLHYSLPAGNYRLNTFDDWGDGGVQCKVLVHEGDDLVEKLQTISPQQAAKEAGVAGYSLIKYPVAWSFPFTV